MSTLTITGKGQITLRKDLLQHLGVHPGEKVTVQKLPNGRIELKAVRPTGHISDVFRFFETGEWSLLVDRGHQRNRGAGMGRQAMKSESVRPLS